MVFVLLFVSHDYMHEQCRRDVVCVDAAVLWFGGRMGGGEGGDGGACVSKRKNLLLLHQDVGEESMGERVAAAVAWFASLTEIISLELIKDEIQGVL